MRKFHSKKFYLKAVLIKIIVQSTTQLLLLLKHCATIRTHLLHYNIKEGMKAYTVRDILIYRMTLNQSGVDKGDS